MIALRDGAAMPPSYAADLPTARPASHVVNIMRAEYREMPCLSLTVRQAMRLWSLDESCCRRHLDALLRDGFLRVTADGVYRRAFD